MEFAVPSLAGLSHISITVSSLIDAKVTVLDILGAVQNRNLHVHLHLKFVLYKMMCLLALMTLRCG